MTDQQRSEADKRCPTCGYEPIHGPYWFDKQQRSEAVELDTTLSVWSSLAPHPPAEKAIRAIVAERDATIAALRAEVELQQWQAAGCLTYAEGCQLGDKPAEAATLAMRTVWQLRKDYQDSREQIAALQSRVDNLAMLVRRLAHGQNNKCETQAMEYLKREGLEGLEGVLRMNTTEK